MIGEIIEGLEGVIGALPAPRLGCAASLAVVAFLLGVAVLLGYLQVTACERACTGTGAPALVGDECLCEAPDGTIRRP